MENRFSKLFIILFMGLLFAQEPAHWKNLKRDNTKYWASEFVQINNLSDDKYKTMAREQALVNISGQIRSTITSDVSLKSKDTSEGFEYKFEESTFVSTMAEIEGAKKEEDELSESEYWVLYSLEKSVHEENMERHIGSALGYYEFFEDVKMNESNDIIAQLQNLVPAYEDVIKVVGKEVLYKESINLRSEIPNQINAALSKLQLVPDGETTFTGKVGFKLNKSLKVQVKTTGDLSRLDIPIRFSFEEGEGTFSKNVVNTSASGKCAAEVTKIISRRKVQRIQAQIDLSQWREDRMTPFLTFEQHLKEISRKYSVPFTIDVSEKTQDKVAVIVVGDKSVYTETDLKRLNRMIRSEFADMTDFKLKDEALIEGIIEIYKRSANLCSNEECQIEIGKKLGVEKLIFVDVADYPKQTSITIFLRNIAENELEQEYTYNFNHRARASKQDKLDVILENAPYMVEDFWYRTNPGYLTLNCRFRGVKANFDFIDPTDWMDKSFEKRLPLTGEKFYEGEYEMSIDKLGFEKYHTRFEVSMGDFPEFDVDLKPKRPFKAFYKSLIIPGRGQLYSSDVDHGGRRLAGLTYMTTTLACLGGSGILWNEFIKARDTYEQSKSEYDNAIAIDDIQSIQAIMTSNHQTMSDKRNTAVMLTGVTAGIWLFNALEAYLFFPSEYKTRRLSFHVRRNNLLAGDTAPVAELKWNF